MAQTIDMRRRLTRPARVRPNWRFLHLHRDVGVGENPVVKYAPRVIENPDAVGLRNRPEGPFPDSNPAGIRDHLEIREKGLDAVILFLWRQGTHYSSSSPKKVLRGVGRATDETATPAPAAGMEPTRGI